MGRKEKLGVEIEISLLQVIENDFYYVYWLSR